MTHIGVPGMKVEYISLRAYERFENPRNMGALPDANGHARITGPCGDTVEIRLRVEDGWVRAATFITTGCGPSRACGSMATELIIGRSIQTALELEQEDILEELEPFPESSRHCALLAANTVKAAAQDFVQRHTTSPDKEKAKEPDITSGKDESA